MQVFVIINKGGRKINAGVNVKNWLTKVYAIKDLFRILVIVSMNVINHVILVSIYTMKIKSVEKKLVDKLVEEYTEYVEEVKLADNENEHKCSSCALHIVLFSIIFTINVAVGTYLFYYKYMNCDGKEITNAILLNL